MAAGSFTTAVIKALLKFPSGPRGVSVRTGRTPACSAALIIKVSSGTGMISSPSVVNP